MRSFRRKNPDLNDSASDDDGRCRRADRTGPREEGHCHHERCRNGRGNSGSAGGIHDVARGGEIDFASGSRDAAEGQRSNRLGDGDARLALGVEFSAAHLDNQRTQHAELDSAIDPCRIAAKTGEFHLELLGLGEAVVLDIRGEDGDRFRDSAHGSIQGDERDIGP